MKYARQGTSIKTENTPFGGNGKTPIKTHLEKGVMVLYVAFMNDMPFTLIKNASGEPKASVVALSTNHKAQFSFFTACETTCET